MTSECDVSLEVLEDFVFLDVSCGRIHEQYALTVVAKNVIIEYLDICSFLHPDSSLSVRTNMVVLLHSSVVLLAMYAETAVVVLLEPVVRYDGIRS